MYIYKYIYIYIYIYIYTYISKLNVTQGIPEFRKSLAKVSENQLLIPGLFGKYLRLTERFENIHLETQTLCLPNNNL